MRQEVNMNEKNWTKSPLRISAVQCNLGEDSDEIFRDFTLDFGFNTEQLNHLFKVNFQGEFYEDKHGALLDRYLEQAHAAGIREIIYYCIHGLYQSDKEEHPEWLQRYRDGKEIPIYGSQFVGCPNTSWRDDCLQRISDLARHDIDGIFLDGPLFFINGCYCPACRKKFAAQYGKELVDATFKEYLDFRMDCLTEFVRDIREAVDRINPGIVLYLNNSALRADITGSNTRKLWKYVDIIGAEGGFFVVSKVESLYMTSAMAKDIECKADGKPTVIFFAGDSKPNSYYMHTAGETMRVLAQSVSNGANVWYGLHGPTALAQTEGAQRAKTFLHELKKYEEYYKQTKPAAKIALLWSTDTANYYSSNVSSSDFTGEGTAINLSETRADHYTEFMGCYEMLAQNHVQFDVVDEVSLERGLTGYELLIAPCCACMSDQAIDSLLSFTESGGNLIASLETGTFDKFGRERDEWPLSKLFGVKKVGVERSWEGLCYQRLDPQRFEGLPEILPAPTLSLRVICEGADTESLRYPPLPGRYERLAAPDPDSPAIVVHNYGKGRVVLFTGNVGVYYFDWKDKNHLRLFGDYVRAMANPRTVTDAPKCVEMTLRQQGERYLLHLINLNVGAYRPMDEILPIRDFKVRLVGQGALHARTMDGQPIPCCSEGQDCVLHVQELRDYLVIVLER